MEAARIEQETPLTRKPVFLGVMFFLISEVFLFGSLFWTYYYLKFHTAVWPPQGVSLDLGLASLNTIFLLLSSGTIWWAGRSIARGNEKGLAWGLLVTILLAAAFLVITIWEWTQESFRPWTHAYGSIFYTLTGFHALHVFMGLLLMIGLLVHTRRHLFTAGRTTAFEVGSMYWHFVDFIWLWVFSSIFIIR